MSELIYDQYEAVIGLEIHVQLSTLSKAFCADATTFGAAPNTQVSTISLGHPGTLPRLNREQVLSAVKLGLALNCQITEHNHFDRKNYFYADLPKGYQITQDAAPICWGGEVPIRLEDGRQKIIRLHHIHMEEDAGKSIHDQDPRHSLIDLNRAGMPLLEIVTEPDLRSPEEVDALMSTMRRLVRYLGISDGNMEQGSMRCDCNISVRPKGSDLLNERCEIKNVNSMRFARKALAYEFKRQIDLISAGGQVQQQTLNFDPATGVTTPLRSKEQAHDYRYFPEPDLPPLHLSPAFVAAVGKQLPALPWALFTHFTNGLNVSTSDAEILTEERSTAEYFLKLIEQSKRHKAVAKLVINKIRPWAQEQQVSIEQFPVAPSGLAEFIQLIESEKVSSSMAYQRLLPALIESPEQSPLALAEQLQLIQSDNEDFLMDIAQQALDKYPDKVAAYRKGKKGLIGFFMGEVMRNSGGKAEPKRTNAILRQLLEQG